MNYLMDGNLAMADHIVWETELGNNIGMDIVTYIEQHGVSRGEAEKAILPLYEEELKALENKSQLKDYFIVRRKAYRLFKAHN
ncbi:MULTISPECIES: hypothetical protein [Bacillus amyloliquefaciens group]|uniref:hypothetical protein n=1 Tax=Bacillus amyloliquefaciens group TaxID=1938374 RepID=UPI000B12C45A|nr:MULTISPECIES: hypothetical protein [Bacillus amyloliquefaciens group]GLZ63232.1 hypothetical protein Bamy02_02850 [Bacillus amyloliquefaciens]